VVFVIFMTVKVTICNNITHNLLTDKQVCMLDYFYFGLTDACFFKEWQVVQPVPTEQCPVLAVSSVHDNNGCKHWDCHCSSKRICWWGVSEIFFICSGRHQQARSRWATCWQSHRSVMCLNYYITLTTSFMLAIT
jgi:hypothetical protein